MYPVSQPSLSEVERNLLLEAFDSTRISSGPMVKRFEEDFAKRLMVKHAVACTSGTTSLHLALLALGIGPNDEVIVPDLTYVASANAVVYTGARPVFVDIDPKTFTLDVRLTANAITERTRAIMPVHLYGQACDLTSLQKLARWRKLALIEDAAEALGGAWHGQALGTLGDIGCFSFFGNKVITTGEGGMAVTHDDTLAARLRHLREMATDPNRRYFHNGLGFNYRMTDLQAAIGVGQLARADELIAKRRAVCERYASILCYHVFVPSGTPPVTPAPWLFTVELPERFSRDRVAALLATRGIETRPTFVPMHEMFGCPDWDDFPISDRVSRQGLSLPTYPDLSMEDVDFISREFLECLK